VKEGRSKKRGVLGYREGKGKGGGGEGWQILRMGRNGLCRSGEGSNEWVWEGSGEAGLKDVKQRR
jgi:hypothetical protein